ncbi:hypothetical protein ACVME8_003879 [Bradyrhizobium diazoefficiens]
MVNVALFGRPAAPVDSRSADVHSNDARGGMVNGWLVTWELASRRHANKTEAMRYIIGVVLANARTHYHRRELLKRWSRQSSSNRQSG